MSGAVHVCRDPDDLAQQAVTFIINSAREAILARGVFTIALSGGSTPERTHKLLARPENAGQVDWAKVQIFMGDERFVPYSDPRSNYGMALRTLLDHVPVPAANRFPIPIDTPTPEAAADTYTTTLLRALGTKNGPPVLDLVLLGLGSDGHTASLFPGKPAASVTDRWVVSSPPGVLPPPVDRVTLTFPAINSARHVTFLIADGGKATLVRDILEDRVDPRTAPAATVRPTQGQLTWLIDQATASALSGKT
jgi:6-phosphogluconolactonase